MSSTPFIIFAAIAVCLAACALPALAINLDQRLEKPVWDGSAYLDLGYLLSDNRPGNHTWRSKSTTTVLDQLRFNNATVVFRKYAGEGSGWGIQIGFQAGKDVDGLVTSNPVKHADSLKHLYYSFVSYLFSAEHNLRITAGLVPGNFGYENFHAMKNPTYTRKYGVDNVPYFNWGVILTWSEDSPVSGSLLLLEGWNYLEHPNSRPSFALQLNGSAIAAAGGTVNLYYGPDQEDTAPEFWRFAVQAIGRWASGSVELAASVGYGRERQATVITTPMYDWSWGAFWVQWQFKEDWSVAARPEFFNDGDGLMTGSRQTITALAATLEYAPATFRRNDLSLRVEIRTDDSTGHGGGFFKGDMNTLVPEQNLFILAAMWHFGYRE